MQTLLNPLFIMGCTAWSVIRISRWAGYTIPILNDYLTDFFAVPVVGTIVLTLMREFVLMSNSYVFPLSYVFTMVIYISIVFEGLLPMLSSKYTADPFDIIAYSLGAFLFHRFINKPISHRSRSGKHTPKSN